MKVFFCSHAQYNLILTLVVLEVMTVVVLVVDVGGDRFTSVSIWLTFSRIFESTITFIVELSSKNSGYRKINVRIFLQYENNTCYFV